MPAFCNFDNIKSHDLNFSSVSTCISLFNSFSVQTMASTTTRYRAGSSRRWRSWRCSSPGTPASSTWTGSPACTPWSSWDRASARSRAWPHLPASGSCGLVNVNSKYASHGANQCSNFFLQTDYRYLNGMQVDLSCMSGKLIWLYIHGFIILGHFFSNYYVVHLYIYKL